MQLTKHTDYALRTLLYLASTPGVPATLDTVADAFVINRHHLAKVVQQLVQLDYIEAKRGPGGGLVLCREPEAINIAEVVKDFEPHFELLECFAPKTSTCPVTRGCALKGVLAEAHAAFVSVLFNYTLADVMGKPGVLAAALQRGR